MDASSLVHTKLEIDDYRDTVGKTRSFAGEQNHQHPGDPANAMSGPIHAPKARSLSRSLSRGLMPDS